MPTPTGSAADPAYRRRRAQLAGRAAHGPDVLIRQLEAFAPTLTDEQAARIRRLLDVDRAASSSELVAAADAAIKRQRKASTTHMDEAE